MVYCLFLFGILFVEFVVIYFGFSLWVFCVLIACWLDCSVACLLFDVCFVVVSVFGCWFTSRFWLFGLVWVWCLLLMFALGCDFGLLGLR